MLVAGKEFRHEVDEVRNILNCLRQGLPESRPNYLHIFSAALTKKSWRASNKAIARNGPIPDL